MVTAFNTLEAQKIRLPKEKELQELLFSTSQVLNLAQKADQKRRLATTALLHILYAEGLQLDEYRSPEIAGCVKQIKKRLSIPHEIEVFVSNDVDSLASVVKVDSANYVVLLKSEIIDLCTLEELSFVIGHELGHVAYEHFVLKDLDADGLPSRLTVKLYEHARLSEVSADRTGLFCCQSFAVAYSALRKIASGTASALIRCDYTADELQTERLKLFLEKKQYLLEATRSHPYSLLRIGALRSLEKAMLQAQGRDVIEMITFANREIDEILSIMSPRASDDESWLLVLAAFWVAYADGSFDLKERREVAKLCSDKEFSDLFNLTREKENPAGFMEDMFVNAYQTVQLTLPKKAIFVEKLVAVARADGTITPDEKETIKYICRLIDIDRRFLNHLIR